MTMTDFRPMPLDSLEDRLGNALGLALGMIRNPMLVDNKAMAQVEGPFKEWCDAIVDGGRLDG